MLLDTTWGGVAIDTLLDGVDTEAEYVTAHAAGRDVARLHSGDLSIYSAVAEQVRRLDRRGIPWTLTPGVPAFAAAARSRASMSRTNPESETSLHRSSAVGLAATRTILSAASDPRERPAP